MKCDLKLPVIHFFSIYIFFYQLLFQLTRILWILLTTTSVLIFLITWLIYMFAKWLNSLKIFNYKLSGCVYEDLNINKINITVECLIQPKYVHTWMYRQYVLDSTSLITYHRLTNEHNPFQALTQISSYILVLDVYHNRYGPFLPS